MTVNDTNPGKERDGKILCIAKAEGMDRRRRKTKETMKNQLEGE